MELLSQKVSQSGGDIFKFAGDAMIILWTPSDETITKESIKKLCVDCNLIRSKQFNQLWKYMQTLETLLLKKMHVLQ